MFVSELTRKISGECSFGYCNCVSTEMGVMVDALFVETLFASEFKFNLSTILAVHFLIIPIFLSHRCL